MLDLEAFPVELVQRLVVGDFFDHARTAAPNASSSSSGVVCVSSMVS